MMAWLVAAATAPVLTVASLSPYVGPLDRPRHPIQGVPAFHRSADRAVHPPASPGRALFNDPLGSERRQFALIRRIDARIDGAGRSSVVRLAGFLFRIPSPGQGLPPRPPPGAAREGRGRQPPPRWG